MELLEALDHIQADDARYGAFFQEDGVALSRGRRVIPNYKQKLARCAAFVEGILKGSIPGYRFQEVMSTSDFPLLFGDIIDRSVLANYEAWPSTWEGIAKRSTMRDFRQAKVYPPVIGADSVLDEVPEAAPYPDAALTEQTPFTWQLYKYGRTVPITWETLVNDDLDQFNDIPSRLGIAAKRTENDNVTKLYVGTAGPDTTLYTSGNKNIVHTDNGALTTNPALSVEGLQHAYTVLGRMVDDAGNPIRRDMVTLVVPPALEITAKNILNAIQINTTRARSGAFPETPGSGTGYQELLLNNWLRNAFNLIVDPYIPLRDGTNGHRAWYLFANPNNSREALRIGFLRGHETPEMWMKSPNAIRIGGGAADPMDGDFDTDSITYKVRHIIGVTRVDPKATVASNGSGS